MPPTPRRFPSPRRCAIPAALLRRALAWAAGLVLWTASAHVAAQQTVPPGEAPPAGPAGEPPPAPESEEKEAAAPEVTMPRLERFEPAVYPAEAEAEGLEGSVVLQLDIDVEGHVTRAEVVEPAGHGFDEAAREAALKFQFAPATRNGQPVAVRILYRYEFALEQPAEEPEPEPPPLGNLEGTLLIDGGDMPLSAAAVTVTAPDGTTTELSSDASGRWSIEQLPAGRYRVTVAAPGFEPVEVVEEVVSGEATVVTYRLAPARAESAESGSFEVVVEGKRPVRDVTRRTIERREMQRIPGTSGDALRSIQSLPGVARPPALAGLLIVRGSAPQSTQVFIDGATVPLIYHFGGFRSAVPTELLDRIDFLPGNFGVRYGRVMGGVIDVALRDPETQCTGDFGKPTDEEGCFHGLAQADLIDGRVLVQGPIGKNWKFAAGARRSWVGAVLRPILGNAGTSVTTVPVFYDYQAIAETRPDESSRLSLRFFGSGDRLEALIKEPFAQEPALSGTLAFRTGFYRAQALYETALSPNVDLYSMVAAGRSKLGFGLGQLKFDLDTVDVNARSQLGFKITRGFKLNAGLDFLMSPYTVSVRGPAAPVPGEPDPGPFSTRPLLEANDTATLFRPAWYAEGIIQPTARATIVPGVRIDYARDSGHEDFSPRISGRYDIRGGDAESDRPPDERRLRTTLKGGVGLFTQPPQPQETNPVFGTPGLLSNRAVHYSIGVEQELTQQIEVSLEGYYKDLMRLVSRSPSLGSLFQYDNAGTGSIMGLETLIKYKADERFFGWIAYTLSRSVRRNRPGEPERLFQYDQTHNLTALGSYRLGRGWEAGARFRIISGPLTTPVLGAPALPALFAADAGSYAQLQGRPFSRRMPLFHQLDVRVDKLWQFRSWKLAVYLDIRNVYNHPAVEAIAYNYNFTASAYQTGLPILPSLGLRAEF